MKYLFGYEWSSATSKKTVPKSDTSKPLPINSLTVPYEELQKSRAEWSTVEEASPCRSFESQKFGTGFGSLWSIFLLRIETPACDKQNRNAKLLRVQETMRIGYRAWEEVESWGHQSPNLAWRWPDYKPQFLVDGRKLWWGRALLVSWDLESPW